MEFWIEVRRRVLSGELSKRQACRVYQLHWSTLKRILEHDLPPPYHANPQRPKPRLESVRQAIETILEADRDVPAKQRHTARRIYQRLCDEHGFVGSESSVRRWLHDLAHQPREVFVPLTQKPGDAQVDFGQARVILGGERMHAALFVLSLPFSDAIFACLFPRECTESFQEGHRRAFVFFQGVPQRIRYDNSKIAVARIVGGRGRQTTPEFFRLQSHYLFASEFCRVRRGNEKGHVEAAVGFSRRNFLVPLPRGESWQELNDQLEAKCRRDLLRVVDGSSRTKQARLDEEHAQFHPLPGEEFEARRVECGRVNSLSLVRFDRNDYSVPTCYGHHLVSLVGGLDRVRVAVGETVVATHPRLWGKGEVSYDPLHYLALLERKPGALDEAQPLAGWSLPPSFAKLRERLEAHDPREGTRQYLRVLRLLERCSLGQLTPIVDQALSLGSISVDAIRVALERDRETPVATFRLDGRDHLKGVQLPPPDLSVYAQLRQGGEA